jgi:hypothetical protein
MSYDWGRTMSEDTDKPYAWMAVGGTIWNHKTREDDVPLYTKSQGDCGETCKRAMLCYACSKELGGIARGDILRCIGTDELCTVEATSTTGKTLVKWGNDDFGTYTAEQIGELFWVEPKPQWQGLTDAEIEEFENMALGPHDLCLEVEAKLEEKNT